MLHYVVVLSLRSKENEVDLDTAVLLAMVTCAYGWFISIGIFEERKEIKARQQAEIAPKQRVRRVEKLHERQQ